MSTLKADEANQDALMGAENARQALRRTKGATALLQEMGALIANLKTMQTELRKLKELAGRCQ